MPAKPPRPAAALPLVSVATARRLLLGAQGLLDDPRGRVTADRLYNLIERMGFVQIDSINVVERAHHLTLVSRLQNYRPSLFDRLLERERRLFEHWTHDASAVPTIWYPYWWSRFERYRRKVLDHPWWKERIGSDPDLTIAHVRERLAREGPLMTRDFEDTRDDGADRSWWGWTPQKAALEYLWRTGEAAVVGRVNFHKVYDLAERALPEAHSAPRPTAEEHLDWACRTAIERLGLASADEVAAFWRAADLPDVRAWCERAAAREEIAPVQVEAMDGAVRKAYAVPDWEERAAALPPAPPRIRLLSPFDPILRDRKRSLRLFGFDYRFEAFVPAPQRRYGYYVLPFLWRDRIAGRADLKSERATGELVVRAFHREDGVRPSGALDDALDRALDRLRRLIGLERVRR